MRELKKLFQAKRVLALALAIAMAVTMLPTTAFPRLIPMPNANFCPYCFSSFSDNSFAPEAISIAAFAEFIT